MSHLSFTYRARDHGENVYAKLNMQSLRETSELTEREIEIIGWLV